MERIKTLISSVEWTWAKTYAKSAPHWYCVFKRNPELDQEFRYFTQYIRDHGVTRKFWSKEFTYLEIEGFEYWSYGAPVEETELINRAEIKTKKLDNSWY